LPSAKSARLSPKCSPPRPLDLALVIANRFMKFVGASTDT
jgi:hypothetical protein